MDWEALKFEFREQVHKLDFITKELARVHSELRNTTGSMVDERSLFEVAVDLTHDGETSVSTADDILLKLTAVVGSNQASKSAHLQRFRNQLSQSKRELGRIVQSIDNMRHRSSLMPDSRSMRSDRDSEAEILLKERGSLGQSIGMIDNAIDNAMVSHSMLRVQNDSLLSVTGKIGGITSQIPFVNTILTKINNRQFQERLILGLVIGVCISILIWMRLLR